MIMFRRRFYYLYSLRLSVLTVIFPFVGRILLLTLFLFPDTPLATTPSSLTCSPNCAGCFYAGAGKCDQCVPGFGLTVNKTCAPSQNGSVTGTGGTGGTGRTGATGGTGGTGGAGGTTSVIASPTTTASRPSTTVRSTSKTSPSSTTTKTTTRLTFPTGSPSSTSANHGGSSSTLATQFIAAVNDNGCLLIGLVVGLPCAVLILMLVIVIIVLLVQISKLRRRMKKLKSREGQSPQAPTGGVQTSNNKTQGNQLPRPYQPMNNGRSEPNREYIRMGPYGYVNDGLSENHIYNSSIGSQTTRPYQPPSHQSSVQTQRYDRSGPFSYMLPENRSYNSSIQTNYNPLPSRREQSLNSTDELDSVCTSSTIVNRSPARNTLIA